MFGALVSSGIECVREVRCRVFMFNASIRTTHFWLASLDFPTPDSTYVDFIEHRGRVESVNSKHGVCRIFLRKYP